MPRQVKDLTEKSTLSDSDWLLVQESNGSCKKVSKLNLVKDLATKPTTPVAATYPSGMALWLENGEFADKSGNGRNAVASGARRPYKVKAFGGKSAFFWDGKNNQQLQVPFFLSGATGATMYIVYSANSDGYILTRTRANDNHTRFALDGTGSFGEFRNARISNYPQPMPRVGDHLVSIHSSASTYEAALNNSSFGVRPGDFNTGNQFLIGINASNYVGAIGLILVYPTYIAFGSQAHNNVITAIGTNYSTLSLLSEFAS